MVSENWDSTLWAATIVLLTAIFFGFIAFVVVSTGNSTDERMTSCVENNMQWIDGSCINK